MKGFWDGFRRTMGLAPRFLAKDFMWRMAWEEENELRTELAVENAHLRGVLRKIMAIEDTEGGWDGEAQLEFNWSGTEDPLTDDEIAALRRTLGKKTA